MTKPVALPDNRDLPAIENGRATRTIEELLGHVSVNMTAFYTHVLNLAGGRGVRSPVDALDLRGGSADAPSH